MVLFEVVKSKSQSLRLRGFRVSMECVWGRSYILSHHWDMSGLFLDLFFGTLSD